MIVHDSERFSGVFSTDIGIKPECFFAQHSRPHILTPINGAFWAMSDRYASQNSASQSKTSSGSRSQNYDHAYVIRENQTFNGRLGMSKKSKKISYAYLSTGVFVVAGLMWAYYDKMKNWLSPNHALEANQDRHEITVKRLYYSLDGPKHSNFAINRADLVQAMASYNPPIPQVQEPLIIPSAHQYANLPEQVQYLIIGSGAAGFAAFRAIRGADADAKVLVVGEEEHLPYMRPPLSKELWFTSDRKLVAEMKFHQWTGKERSVFYEKDQFYCDPMTLNDKEHGGVSMAPGRKVVKLDIQKHEAFLDDGSKLKYEKCLIATGGHPKMLKEIADGGDDVLKHVTLYRRLEDFRKIDEIIHKAKSLVIVGGGFLGTELACALVHKARDKNVQITQLFPEPGNLSKVLPEYLSRWTTDKIRNEGVNVMNNALIEKATFESDEINLYLKDGRKVTTDHLILAVGIDPNVELAKTSGLEVDPEIGGFRCDAELRARTDVWVAGDCCSFYDPQLSRRRVEHQDHAIVSGRLVGENMAGANKPYRHQSMFWSDMGLDLGLEAIGLVDSSLPTVGVFAKASESETSSIATETVEPNDRTASDFDRGIVFYLREKKIVGILLWNLYSRISVARRILKEDVIFEDLNEFAKLFNIHDAPPVSLSEKD